MEKDENRSSIFGSRSVHELAEFWDSHDATGSDEQTHEVGVIFDIRARRHYIAVDPELLVRLRELAYARGLSMESLANLLLQERVMASES